MFGTISFFHLVEGLEQATEAACGICCECRVSRDRIELLETIRRTTITIWWIGAWSLSRSKFTTLEPEDKRQTLIEASGLLHTQHQRHLQRHYHFD
ncbi:hypothetical protein RB195_019732 [Necator americanus]